MLDAIDRSIINALQGGFPLTERPFADAGRALGLEEGELVARIDRLLKTGRATRFGPMFNADRMGGAFCLCAMAVPAQRFEAVAAIVNALPEVAHNYERHHRLNMWFVLATATPDGIEQARRWIEAETGLEVLAFPKLAEFFIGLKVAA
jgi:DNA-binding Lrp family transcriptional regulator